MKTLCTCCNKLKSDCQEVQNNTYISQYICKECLTTSQETTKNIVESIKSSKNEFKKSLVLFFNENGFLTQKQVDSIKLTDVEQINLDLINKDFNSLLVRFSFISSKKQQNRIVNFFINNDRKRELKVLLKNDIEDNSDLFNLIKEYLVKEDNKINDLSIKEQNGLKILASEQQQTALNSTEVEVLTKINNDIKLQNERNEYVNKTNKVKDILVNTLSYNNWILLNDLFNKSYYQIQSDLNKNKISKIDIIRVIKEVNMIHDILNQNEILDILNISLSDVEIKEEF